MRAIPSITQTLRAWIKRDPQGIWGAKEIPTDSAQNPDGFRLEFIAMPADCSSEDQALFDYYLEMASYFEQEAGLEVLHAARNYAALVESEFQKAATAGWDINAGKAFHDGVDQQGITGILVPAIAKTQEHYAKAHKCRMNAGAWRRAQGK
jgi:hypothetical protein